MVHTVPAAAPRGVARCAGVAGCLALLALGCEPAEQVVRLPLALREVAACPVGSPRSLELVALGDFPSRTLSLPADASLSLVDPLPPDVRELIVRVTSERSAAEGRHIRDEASAEGLMWLLPSEPSCPLGDTYLRASEGAVVAALPGAGALIAGGSDGGTLASAEAFRLVEGQEIGSAVEGGMLLRRAFASATWVGDALVVAGGTADRRASAHDTYEQFDLHAERFVAARSGKLQAARMQHGALRLADDQLLLVGGRSEADAPPLGTAELLNPRTGHGELLMGAAGLQLARAEPGLLMLDSGRVLVLGGRDAQGRWLGSVELYEPEPPHFELSGLALPVREEVAVAALPGARAAWLACDHADDAAGARCELALLLADGAELQRAAVALPFDELLPNGLKQLQLVYAGRGELLLTGADDSDPTRRRRAFLIDPSGATLHRVDASRVPSHLLRLHNGIIAELDATGCSVRGARTHGPFASLDGDALSEARAALVFDAPGHWLWQEQGVRALVSGARVDLDELRFASFRANFALDGDYAVVLYDGIGHRLDVRVQAGRIALAQCRAALPRPGRLTLQRVGDTLRVTGTSCSAVVGSEHLGIGLRLEQDTLLSGWEVRRM